jgi:predicted nucleic acid-binding protein
LRFWDASAVLPLIVEEAGTELALRWLREDQDMMLWGLTRLELASAIECRTREGLLRERERSAALRRIQRIADDAHEIVDLAAVRARGIAVLARHALRAADAAQLGAALLVADPEPASLTAVVFDRRLASAAEREGFHVLTWPE